MPCDRVFDSHAAITKHLRDGGEVDGIAKSSRQLQTYPKVGPIYSNAPGPRRPEEGPIEAPGSRARRREADEPAVDRHGGRRARGRSPGHSTY
jgi:hypothetical protein